MCKPTRKWTRAQPKHSLRQHTQSTGTAQGKARHHGTSAYEEARPSIAFSGLSQSRFINLSAAAGTFLTFSLSPITTMPVARADGEDIIIDQIINSLSAVDPTAALDMTSWISSLDAALQGAANFDPSSLDAALGGASALDPSSLDSAVAAASADPSSAAADPAAAGALANLYGEFYLSSHAFDQKWIDGTTFLGNLTVQYDNSSTGSGHPATETLIGNGATV